MAPRSAWFSAYALMLGEFDPETYQASFWMNFFFHCVHSPDLGPHLSLLPRLESIEALCC